MRSEAQCRKQVVVKALVSVSNGVRRKGLRTKKYLMINSGSEAVVQVQARDQPGDP